MAQYPTETEHYFLLETGELEATADCGCRMRWQDGVIRLYQCSMHATAEDMLKTLERLRIGVTEMLASYWLGDAGVQVEEAAEIAKQVVRRARGEVLSNQVQREASRVQERCETIQGGQRCANLAVRSWQMAPGTNVWLCGECLEANGVEATR